MPQDFKKLFSHLKPFKPQDELFDKIMGRIEKEQKFLKVRRRIIIFSISFLGSFLALIPTFQMVKTSISESNFIEFFSLLFSDGQIIITYWQDFALSLLESLPILSLILFLIIVFVFLWSLRFLLKNIRTIFIHKIIET